MKTTTQLELAFFAGLVTQAVGVYIVANVGPALLLVGTELAAVALWGMTRIARRSPES